MKKLIICSLACASIGFGKSGSSPGDFLSNLDLDSDSSEFEDIDLEDEEPALQIFKTVSVDADVLISDDVNIQRYSAELELAAGKSTYGLSYRRIEYDLDITGGGLFDTESRESTDLLSLSYARKWTDNFSSSLALSGYKGFTNFRSIWTTEAFDQLSEGVPGFREANPFGFSANLTNTYILPNDFDSISWSLGYSRDRIAPGQVPTFVPPNFFGVVPSDDTLDTLSTSFTGNFYVTNKVTTQLFARTSVVSEREVRTQLRIKTAWNIVDSLILRGEIGTTFESPEFESYYGGVTLNYQILDSLYCSLGYRIYTDSGEINTSNFNSAAPEFDSQELSLALQWIQGAHAVTLSAAYLDTEFGEVGLANSRFGGLFSDREFVALRAAYTTEF